MPESAFFRDLAYLLSAAVIGGGLARLLRLPAFVGYILGGLAVTSLAGRGVAAAGTFHLFAEFGVVLLMFSLGVEFSLRELWRVRGLAVVGVPLGLAGIVSAVVWALPETGAFPGGRIVAGLALAVCSTTALAKLLEDRGDLNGPVGRASIGISLAQDLAVVAAIFLIPALAGAQAADPVGLLAALARAAAVLGPFFILASWLVPALLGRVAHTQSAELFVLVAMAIGVGTAALSAALGLSLALGAFLAGLVISESDHTVETLARLLPLRDLFVAVFFVSVGMLIDVSSLLSHPTLVLKMVAVILAVKAAVWTAVTLLFAGPLPMALAVGIGQTQIGEFSFVVAQIGRSAGLISEPVHSAILAAAVVTLLVNALVFRRSRPLERWADRFAAPGEPTFPDASPAVLIAGYGRVGGTVGEALEVFQVPFVVVDSNPIVTRALRDRGIPAVLGDAANDLALRHARATEVQVALLAIPDTVKAEIALRRLRLLNPAVAVISRAHSREEVERLLAAGATEVILPEVEAGMTLVDHTLHRLLVPSGEVRAYLRRMRELERPAGRPSEAPPPARTLQAAVVEVAEGPLAHRTLRRTRIRERTGVVVVGIDRSGEETHWNPGPEAVPMPGDRVTVVGLPEQIDRFRRLNAGLEERDPPLP